MTTFSSYQAITAEYIRLLNPGEVSRASPTPRPDIADDAPKILLFSPHPDDECIVGGFPLRLLRELHWNAIDVAVTQGSRKDRQQERWQELERACEYLGFGLRATQENGLEKINPETRKTDARLWGSAVEIIVGILSEYRPQAIFFPHDRDWNRTHIGTHYLVRDALDRMDADFSCWTVETEYWGAMSDPNLAIASSSEEVADLMAALSFHIGEIQRNPYHLRLPPWMADNVRRGGELVGGQGEAAPDFAFATLYRMRQWADGQFKARWNGGRTVACGGDLQQLFSSK
ncbi:PIG-L family deacetylase [Lusitaniella coriacea LEGE 07157]|uniref:PIG-L family deacetylase n=1 Tax=Lusitaniella coriacea LEGE 07157 TaxID=945747 RepID=A0A8J7DZW5_9CYAN|nr:PIG-L family deacetylase [Lusitaniella coriacea]MBE9118791.1 PIG-L family deacetylase [Lusitaniella coriacea LEGE 07157]